MKLTVLGSSSAGNCYILENEKEALVLEAGCKLADVKKALRWNIAKIAGAVVTHRHNDHAAYVKDFASSGILVMALSDVLENKGIKGFAFTKEVEPMKGYKVGGFKIFAFPVYHDVPCLGYVVEHDDLGKLLFVTDTMMLEYKFEGINHFLLEANYADDILAENLELGRVPVVLKKRLEGSHMELQTTKEILMANDLSQCSDVVLIHLSDGNSDETRFIQEVRDVAGVPTYAARKGFELYMNKNPY